METPITARYHLTDERMAEGLRVHAKLTRGRGARAFLVACELVALGCLGYAMWNVEFGHWTAWLVLPMALFVLAMFSVINFFGHSDRSHRLIARFLLARTPEGSKDVEWHFDADGLEQRTSLSATAFRWAMVTKVVEVPTGFLIHRGKLAVDWIPGDGFDSPVAGRLFVRLAQVHAPEYDLIGECRTADLEIAHR